MKQLPKFFKNTENSLTSKQLKNLIKSELSRVKYLLQHMPVDHLYTASNTEVCGPSVEYNIS